MCICDIHPDVGITEDEVQEYARLEDLAQPTVVRREMVDGRPVVLFEAVNAFNRKVHCVLCPGDLCYRTEKRTLPSEKKEVVRIAPDTYKCPRKEQFRNIVRGEVEASYRKSRLTCDAAKLIMNIFERIKAGEYLGEFSPGAIYASELSEMLSQIYPRRPGLIAAKTFCSFGMRKKRFANSRPPFFLSLGLPLEKILGKLRVDNTLSFAPLTDAECRTAAFFEDTLTLIERLVDQKKLGLHGMILCTPYPDEIPDGERVLLKASDAALIFMREEGKFLLQVQRHYNPEFATLCIFEKQASGRACLLAGKKIRLFFGAEFGPDVSDVELWQDIFEHFIRSKSLK